MLKNISPPRPYFVIRLQPETRDDSVAMLNDEQSATCWHWPRPCRWVLRARTEDQLRVLTSKTWTTSSVRRPSRPPTTYTHWPTTATANCRRRRGRLATCVQTSDRGQYCSTVAPPAEIITNDALHSTDLLRIKRRKHPENVNFCQSPIVQISI